MSSVAEYLAEVQALVDQRNAGQLNHKALRDRMRTLKNRYRDQGVNVDAIGFGSTGSTARNPEGTFKDVE